MKKSLICITCPLGCNLTVKYNDEKVESVDGHSCKRGELYAEKEIFSPERVVTSTVKINNASIEFLPVKTDKAIPKNMMNKIMEVIFDMEVDAPISVGEVLVENILETGANLVATRTFKKC